MRCGIRAGSVPSSAASTCGRARILYLGASDGYEGMQTRRDVSRREVVLVD
jgi:hypothetical protein